MKQKEELLTGDTHVDAHRVVSAFQLGAPEGRANTDMSDEDVEERLAEVVSEMGFEDGSDEARRTAKWLGESLENRSLTLLDVAWSGRELLDIEHLTGKAIVKVNKKHPFYSNMLGPLKAMAGVEADDLDPGAAIALLRRLSIGMDLLILAYAKAENMAPDPDEDYGDLRSDWGRFSNGLVREAMKMEA